MYVNIANTSNIKHMIKNRHKNINYMIKQINIYMNLLKLLFMSSYKTYLNFCNV